MAEQERECDRQSDRGDVIPAQRSRDHHPNDFADHAACEAVVRRTRREPIELSWSGYRVPTALSHVRTRALTDR